MPPLEEKFCIAIPIVIYFIFGVGAGTDWLAHVDRGVIVLSFILVTVGTWLLVPYIPVAIYLAVPAAPMLLSGFAVRLMAHRISENRRYRRYVSRTAGPRSSSPVMPRTQSRPQTGVQDRVQPTVTPTVIDVPLPNVATAPAILRQGNSLPPGFRFELDEGGDIIERP